MSDLVQENNNDNNNNEDNNDSDNEIDQTNVVCNSDNEIEEKIYHSRVHNINLTGWTLRFYLEEEIKFFSDCDCVFREEYPEYLKRVRNFNHFLGITCIDPKKNEIAKMRKDKYFYNCMYKRQTLLTTTPDCDLTCVTHLLATKSYVKKDTLTRIKFLSMEEFPLLEFLEFEYHFEIKGFNFGSVLKHLVVGVPQIREIINQIINGKLPSSLERITFILYFKDYDYFRPEYKKLDNSIKLRSLKLKIDFME